MERASRPRSVGGAPRLHERPGLAVTAPFLREATVVRERLDADEKRLLPAGGEELGPPLREHAEDILLLVRHFVQHFAQQMNRTIDTISSCRIDAERLEDSQPSNRDAAHGVSSRGRLQKPKGGNGRWDK